MSYVAVISAVICFGLGLIAAVVLSDRAYDRGWNARDSIGTANGERHCEPTVPEVGDPVIPEGALGYVPPQEDD